MKKYTDLLKKYIDDPDKVSEILEAMKSSGIHLCAEENLDERYTKLREQLNGKDGELQATTATLAELKTAAEGAGALQEQVIAHEATIETLKAENAKLKLDGAIKVELLANNAKPTDLDYLMYKISQGDVSMDDKGNLKGCDIEALKTAHPSNFEQKASSKIDVNLLPGSTPGGDEVTKEQFAKMSYNEKNELAQKDPQAYAKLTKPN